MRFALWFRPYSPKLDNKNTLRECEFIRELLNRSCFTYKLWNEDMASAEPACPVQVAFDYFQYIEETFLKDIGLPIPFLNTLTQLRLECL